MLGSGCLMVEVRFCSARISGSMQTCKFIFGRLWHKGQPYFQESCLKSNSNLPDDRFRKLFESDLIYEGLLRSFKFMFPL